MFFGKISTGFIILTRYFYQPQGRPFSEEDIISVGRFPDEVTFYMNPDDQADYYVINYRLEGEDEVWFLCFFKMLLYKDQNWLSVKL